MNLKYIFLGGMVLLSSCLLFKPTPSDRSYESLEYFQRMDRQDFLSKYSWNTWLIPAANAELPPQYQNAFSLYLRLDPQNEKLSAEYHFQRMIDPKSHVFIKRVLESEDYQSLSKLLEKQDLICTSQVERSWVGPAPKLLRLSRPDSKDLIYADGPGGPEGPSQELAKAGKRRHLCSEELTNYLGQVIQALKIPQSAQPD